MQKFDKSAAWDDVKRLLGAHPSLVAAIAGVFIFLPQLLLSMVTPVQDPAASALLTPEQQLALMQSTLTQILPFALIAGVITAVGNAAILRLWLSRTEISVGDALKTGLGLVITIFIIQVLTSIGMFFGLLLFILPGIYLWVRWSVATAYAVDMNERNPLAAMGASWRLTKGNVFSIFLFVLLLMIALTVILIMLTLLSSAFALIPVVGLFVTQALQAFLATVASVVFIAVVAATYRQLVVLRGAVDGF